MPIDLGAYLIFSLAIQFTPGPNNIMLASSGMNFGVRKTLPHLWGIVIGVPVLMLSIGLGVDQLVAIFPNFQLYLMVFAIGLLLIIAYRIIETPLPSAINNSAARPVRFLESLLFQCVNPKGWSMITSSIGLFVTATDDTRLYQLWTLCFVNIVLTAVSALVWLFGGLAIRRFLTRDIHFRLYNLVCALLLVGCAVYIAFSQFSLTLE